LYCVRKGFSISDVNKAIKIYEKGEDIWWKYLRNGLKKRQII
jgi:hypothetical protein